MTSTSGKELGFDSPRPPKSPKMIGEPKVDPTSHSGVRVLDKRIRSGRSKSSELIMEFEADSRRESLHCI